MMREQDTHYYETQTFGITIHKPQEAFVFRFF